MLPCRGLGSPPRVPAKAQKCLQVSWEPQSKALDQEEMCPGLGLNFDGQPGGVLAIAALTLTFLSCSTSAPSLCLLAQTSGAL